MNKPSNPMVPELTVSNFAGSLKFYHELLGFDICYQRQSPYFAYLDKDGAELMLEECHKEAWVSAELEQPFGRGINLQITVTDIESLWQRVQQYEIAVFRPLNEIVYTTDHGDIKQREFLMQDPDGYLLRFCQK